MSAPAVEKVQGRTVVQADRFEKHVTFLQRHDGLTREMAERVMDQAYAFMVVAAKSQERPLVPSGAVDPGWHAALLDNGWYGPWLDSQGLPFLVHNIQTGSGARDGAAVRRTMRAIEDAGFVLDRELWEGSAADCNGTPCDSDDGRDYRA